MRKRTRSRGALLLVVGKTHGYDVPLSMAVRMEVLFRIDVFE